ncbi:rhomboid family intramembrane serine protease [Lacticaseibacillus saniviri]|uniref:Membrane-associated serine protease n=1 Tax=Lacticaseibacillus saniviri JCM 17471 = DSM 24301 TaxID=1293598 RepID=A0A0R2MYB2_9LACO|nr:rhomboid family intramembrane serine protease [Lacticaseibacillus saniviri]KRO18551.1 Membrane-associated serine protease [Lacticaseibacillus saniviri JCM 17471 = DSM 24301]MCG4281567.1 rhomboid family intramembrane serine protease [Lacticaseibacillus saniviri]
MRQSNWKNRLNNMPFMTYGLLAITFAVYLLETLKGGSTNTMVLLDLGARYNPLIAQGEWWRLFTPMFLHIGLMHLVVNAVSIYYLGMMTEQIFGHARFLAIYLLSGIAGNYVSMVFNANALAAGASTAIFGLFGAFLMLGDNFRENPAIRSIAQQYLLLVGINLVFNLFGSGIDIAGHIGGLIGGFLVAGVLGAPNIGLINRNRRILMGVVLVIAVVAVAMIGVM